MMKIYKKLILTFALFIIASGARVYALSPISVSFSSTPLFSVLNFMPGDIEEASVDITNRGEVPETAYIEAVNISNSDNLASQMILEILESQTSRVVYFGNFQDFINEGPVELSNILPETSKKFILKISFLEKSGNDYQGKNLGFDLCVGFAGGSERCTTDKAIGEENATSDDSPSSGGGLGGSHLVIWGEETREVSSGDEPNSGFAVITWETSKPSTSQVIYGPASGSYILDMNNEPGFGYPSISEEDLSKKTHHSVVITGLTLGETYVYRVVSRASPPSVSYEHAFMVPGAGNKISASNNLRSASTSNYDTNVRSENDGGNNSSTTNDAKQGNNDKENQTDNFRNMAAALFSNYGSLPIWLVLILIIIITVYLYLAHKNKDRL